MAETFKAGVAKVEVDMTAALRAIDAVSEGAAGRFVTLATDTLQPIEQGAVGRWPVATGRSRGAFHIASRVTETSVSVQLLNPAFARGRQYAWFIRYAKRTKEQLIADARTRSFARKRGSQEAKSAAFDRAKERINGPNPPPMAPDASLANKNPWALYVRKPARDATPALIAGLQADLARLARSG
jgi:hypothetical protein